MTLPDSAAARLAAADALPARELCRSAADLLAALADVMNRETTLLRSGRFREAGPLAAQKGQLAQDYVGMARAVQRQAERLRAEAPEALEDLRAGHERLATQMADNLRVIATARTVADDLLRDVSARVGQASRARTYGAGGTIVADPAASARGIAVNRAL